MDFDEEAAIADWLILFDPPQAFPWRGPKPRQIEARRAQMTDMLLFDVLLVRGGIRNPDMLYPPADYDSLQRLLDAIKTSSYDNLKKDCLVYILLKWFEDGRESRFQEERCIPPQFVSLADAYWYLDTGVNIAKAVSILSDARLNRDYASKILQAISLADNSSQLIVKYVNTAKPPLIEPDDIDTYALALADLNLLEAWQYQRSFPGSGDTRARILNKLLNWCLSPKPRSAPLSQLLAFPLSEYEQNLLHDYALNPPKTIPSSSIPIIQDLACVRLVQGGRYAEAIKLDRQFSGVVNSRDSEAFKAMQDRRRMMDDILGTMSAVERSMIEAELNPSDERRSAILTASRSKLPVTGLVTGTRTPNDLSMSWEEVPLPLSSVNGSAPHARSVDAKPAGATSMPAMPRLSLSHLSSSRSSLNGSTSGLPHQNLFSAPSTVMATQAQKFPLGNVTLNPLSSSLSSSLSTPPAIPLVGPSSLSITHGALQKSLSGKPSTNGVHPATSLFEKSGSANQTPNAFYTPPVNAGLKRSFGHDSTPRVSNPIPEPPKPAEPPVDDVNMESDEESHAISGQSIRQEDDIEEEEPEQLSFSVFGRTNLPSESRAPQRKSRRTLPGAFMDEDDSEPETSHPPVTRPPPPKQTRERKARAAKHDVDLNRSIPGSLASEEIDEVAPLPPSPINKRPSRKARISKKDTDADDTSRPRRSSRLSVASSSPEPLSPPKLSKGKKSTRSSIAGGPPGTSKSSSRRKR